MRIEKESERKRGKVLKRRKKVEEEEVHGRLKRKGARALPREGMCPVATMSASVFREQLRYV